MQAFINRYISIINHETSTLLDSPFETLTPIQMNIIQIILQHTDELLLASTKLEERLANSITRHELLNILTPIAGYVDMLSDGWLGDLSEQQRDRIKLIYVAVHRLTKYILDHSTESHMASA